MGVPVEMQAAVVAAGAGADINVGVHCAVQRGASYSLGFSGSIVVSKPVKPVDLRRPSSLHVTKSPFFPSPVQHCCRVRLLAPESS